MVFWETMLGRHVKPGNGRKRKRAVWAAPASPPGGYREPGDGEVEGYWSTEKKVETMKGERSGGEQI